MKNISLQVLVTWYGVRSVFHRCHDKHFTFTLQTYLAMAKGAVVDDHVLICSIAHHSSTLALPDDTAAECEMYKIALATAMKSIGKQCVFFERNYRTDHVQIQVGIVRFIT